MKISVFGLGYVGTVSAACLAENGHNVMGIDPNQTKVDLINRGQTPIIEKEVGPLIKRVVENGRLAATTDAITGVINSDICLVCVGTPSNSNGSLDLKFVTRVCEEIGTALREKSEFQTVAIRSTILPGSMRQIVIPTLQKASGKRVRTDFGVCNNPEFLREGSAVFDFHNPPKTVIGESDSRSGDQLASLYSEIDAPLIRTDMETAEMVKYVDNAWHALKVGFSNEIGNLCKVLQLDSHKVMEIFCQDTKLNISTAYLKPGFAFGGSCLPKDLRALNYKAKNLDLNLPILEAILPSNERQLQIATRMVIDKQNKRVGILGLSFKAGTDDLRESPMVELVERLLGKGYDLRIYDRNVKLAALVGANREYIASKVPHISQLMVEDVEDVVQHADTVVIGNSDEEFKRPLETLDGTKSIVDLTRMLDRKSTGNYDGICW